MSSRTAKRNKKADVADCPQAFHHVGLLFNEPSGHCRVALYLVIRTVAPLETR
jgi:hypothetical protein